MIVRVWHGWTEPENADAYERLLRDEILAGIAARGIPGLNRIRLLRRSAAAEVEFVTLMWFHSLAAVRQFAGEDYEAAVVPPKARALLARFDERSQHYEEIDPDRVECDPPGRGQPPRPLSRGASRWTRPRPFPERCAYRRGLRKGARRP